MKLVIGWLLILVWIIAIVMTLYGCANPASYQPVPAWLVPVMPAVPMVSANDLACLSDAAYIRLAERDRACWQHVKELRAVLGADLE